jgi:hypothetical protein
MGFSVPLLELCACGSGQCSLLFGNTAHICIRIDACAEFTTTTYYQESLKSAIVFTVLFSYALLASHPSEFNYHFSNMR